MEYRICVVGLGLMGASLAGALRGFRGGAAIVGVDVDEDVCRKAELSGVVRRAYARAGDGIAGADLIIFCVYARHIPALVEANRAAFKPGALVSDICGVKSALYAKLDELLPDGVRYVGVHPMAGRERDGFENSDPAIFANSGFLICPHRRTAPEDVLLMRAVAAHIGATRIAVSEPGEHDAIIAYTSDLMHIASASLCANPGPEMSPAFTAGAFRDCTRVADINADAWTELLMDNRRNTLARLDDYIGSLREVRAALIGEDSARLRAILRRAGDNKRRMLKMA
jgi:prephenate dehydrogenase